MRSFAQQKRAGSVNVRRDPSSTQTPSPPPPAPTPAHPTPGRLGGEAGRGGGGGGVCGGGGGGRRCPASAGDRHRAAADVMRMVRRIAERVRVDEHVTLARDSWRTSKRRFTTASSGSAGGPGSRPKKPVCTMCRPTRSGEIRPCSLACGVRSAHSRSAAAAQAKYTCQTHLVFLLALRPPAPQSAAAQSAGAVPCAPQGGFIHVRGDVRASPTPVSSGTIGQGRPVRRKLTVHVRACTLSATPPPFCPLVTPSPWRVPPF